MLARLGSTRFPGIFDKPPAGSARLELREKARKELGERFDLRKFHDQVLGAGVLPLDRLEKRIESWIARTLGG